MDSDTEATSLLNEALADVLGDRIAFEESEEGILTLDYDSDRLRLLLLVREDEVVIRNIRVGSLFQDRGIGKRVIGAIHECADELGLPVVADRVEDSAVGFWQRMGYEPRPQAGEGEQYIRSPG
jgi:GNAT superfamily N-acetyltransferase